MLPMCIAVALRNSFFLHFAGHRRDMEAYDPDVVARDRSVVMGPRYIQRVASEWTALAEAGAKTEKRET